MKNSTLHIVCLDVPFPADYGGAIDMFYRIKALHSLGLDLKIHVFEYGRGKQKELNKYGQVFYYKRKRSVLHLLSSRPFIVETRSSQQLLNELKKDNAPILLEGIHTCSILEDPEIQQRLTMVRMHNVEHDYYRGLKDQTRWLRKLFFRSEASKLASYEKILIKAKAILAIKEEDADHFRRLNSNTFYLPASFPEIKGSYQFVKRYGLIHGNLSVPENEQAIYWIISSIKPVLEDSFPIIVAGKNPGKKLKQYCSKMGVELISNPTEEHLYQLVQEAQIHLLHTAVPSGIKLKLLSCLHSSGHILTNSLVVGNTPIAPFCVVADQQKDYRLHFIGLKNTVLTNDEFLEREQFLKSHFDTAINCQLIVKLIGEYES